MTIVDTSVWIEYLKGGNPEVTQALNTQLKKRKVVAVSAVFGELLQGVKNKREKEIVQQFWQYLPQVDEKHLFIEAGLLSQKLKLTAKDVGIVDAYILSVALQYDFSIWTLDKKLSRVIDEVSF